MTLEQLKLFAAVAERQHVTRAATSLNLTQSAVSASIAQLERQFGLRLFDRIGRGIALTEAGQFFLGEARAILGRAAAAERAMAEYAGMRRGRLTIAASQTIASYFLPERLVRFRRDFPGIELEVSAGNSAQVARAVKQGEAEIGFVEGPLADPVLDVEPVALDVMIVVVPPGHPWAAGRPTSAELAAADWILREDGSGTRIVFENAMAELGIGAAALRAAIALPSNEAVRAAVEAGAGVAALSSLVCAGSLAAKTLAQAGIELPARPFNAIQHIDRFRSKAARAFLHLIRQDPTARADKATRPSQAPGA